MNFNFLVAVILGLISVGGAIFGFRQVSKTDLFCIRLSPSLTWLYRLHWFNVLIGALIPVFLLDPNNAWDTRLLVILSVAQFCYWVAGAAFIFTDDDDGSPYSGKGGGW